MAKKKFWSIDFGLGSCGRQNVIVANTVVGANVLQLRLHSYMILLLLNMIQIRYQTFLNFGNFDCILTCENNVVTLFYPSKCLLQMERATQIFVIAICCALTFGSNFKLAPNFFRREREASSSLY